MDYSSDIKSLYFAQTLPSLSPQSTIFLLLALLVLLALIFIISGAEVALFTMQPKDVNILKTKNHPGARRIISLLKERKSVYTTLLIAGGVFTICIIIVINYLITPLLHLGSIHFIFPIPLNILVKIVIITFTIVVFCKMLPKVWASHNKLRFAYTSSATVELLHTLFGALSNRMVRMADRINKSSGASESEANSMRELDDAIDVENEETSVEEKNILKGIIKFNDITVKQIMRMRLDVNGVAYNAPFREVIKRVEDLHYSRLPVYKASLDEIAGMINTKDLLPFIHLDNFEWQSLIRPTLFIPESLLIKDLLKTFQTKRIHFAIVVDEFGGTCGIVTMEDIMEEIIGEIRDEFDDEESSIKFIRENTYVADAKIMLYDLCRAMRLPIDTFDAVKGESDSLAGLLLELAGKLPSVNEIITSGDYVFTILDVEKHRIKQVKIEVSSHE